MKMETPAGAKEGERCKHEMLPGQCADCKVKRQHGDLMPKRRSMSVSARFPDRCRECDDLIHIGDAIVPKGYYWIHIECKD